jgi:hypothetical protein
MVKKESKLIQSIQNISPSISIFWIQTIIELILAINIINSLHFVLISHYK